MNKNSKIAFVMPWHISERGGGAEVQANYLAQQLGERGFKVFYICQTMNRKKINTYEVIGHINIHWLKPSGRFSWLDQNKYLKSLQSIKPNYILQRLSSNVTYVLGKYAKKNQCRFIWFCTDNHSPFSNFHVKKFKERFTVKSLGILKYCLFALNNRIMDYYRNKGMNLVDIAFSQNDFQRLHIKQNFGLSSSRMISGHPLPNGQDDSKMRFLSKTILWCANLGTHKRPDLFLRLAHKMAESPYKFIMVGGHSDKNYVTHLFKDKPSNLEVVGQVSFKESLTYFDGASLLVNTSLSEGFSNTYVQAWLRGIPTLVFGSDPNEVIKINNLGADVNDICQAEDYLNKLFSSEVKYYQMFEHIRHYAKKNHSINFMVDKFLEELKLNQ